jgi:hypothetical protein
LANTFLTIAMIGYAMLPVLHNNIVAAKKVTRKYEDQFAKKGAKIGATFMVRKPPRYVVTKGATFVPQDYTEESVPLTITEHDQVGVEFGNDDMTLSMDDFQHRFLEPALVPLANSIDVFVMSKFYQVWNATGTPGTTAATDTPFLDAKTLLINNAADERELEKWPMIVTPRVTARLSSGLAGRFNPQLAISQLYEKGAVGQALGFMFYDSQNMPTQTTGAYVGAGTVSATAGQTGASINTIGWANSVTGLFNIGDVIQFAGVYMVNPITKNNIGELQNFVITATANSDGSGLSTLSISPSIILSGKDQTVSNAPAASAPITIYGGTYSGAGQTAAWATSGVVSPQCLAWSLDAITLAMVDFELFGEGEGVKCIRVNDPDGGFSLMFTRGTDIKEFSRISRVDCLYGTTLTRPEHMVRTAA